MNLYISILVVTVFSFTSCGKFFEKNEKQDADPLKESQTSDLEQESPLSLTGALKTFQNCDETEEYVKAEIIAVQTKNLENEIKWFLKADRYRDNLESVEEADDASPSSAKAGSSAGPDDYTTTNNQVDGVEEADFIKNTGTHIYQIDGKNIRIIKSWPANEMALETTIKLESKPFQLLLNEGKLIVLANPKMDIEGTDKEELLPETSHQYMRYDNSVVEVMVYDVSDPIKPAKSSTFLLNGYYQNSRRVGASVRIILSSYPSYWEYIDYLSPYDQKFKGVSKNEIISALRVNHEENIEKIQGMNISEWLQLGLISKVDESGKKVNISNMKNCEYIHAPTVSTQFGVTQIATINTDTDSATESVILAHSNEIYSSKESLYLTSRYWWWDDENIDTDYTFIHKFSLEDPEYALYQGSGGVKGHLLNQFSMDEFEGNLRVATTVNQREKNEDNSNRGFRFDTVNKISILASEGERLKVIGETENLAKGERIFSVRFNKAKGFMVTFRQVDPLFTFDLSDPKNPKVLGELKIPGFSSYMQILDENHILTIGREGTDEGRILGLKLSIFDVSDLANPVESQKLVLNGNFWSEAQYNHKAFTYFPSKKLLGIPVSGYRDVRAGDSWWDRYRSSLMVFNIDSEKGISSVGEIDMTNIYTGTERNYGWWSSAARVYRSIFADDYVYAISNLGVKVSNISALDEDVSIVNYECDDDCFNNWYLWY